MIQEEIVVRLFHGSWIGLEFGSALALQRW